MATDDMSGTPSVDELDAQEAAIDLAFDDAVRHKSRRTLEQLRDRVETAMSEIERLRKENAELTERLQSLEQSAHPDDPNRTVITIDERPEVARRKVNRFIEVLDTYLEQE